MKLRSRLFLGAILTTLLAIGVVIASINMTINTILQLQDPLQAPEENVERCLADPTTWNNGLLNFARVYAYYPDGTSENPNALPIHEEYLRRLNEENLDWIRDRNGGMVRTGDSGPCALFQARLSTSPLRGAVFWALVLGSAIAMLVVTTFTQFFTVNPLLVRLGRVQRAARSVGNEMYVDQADKTGDSLSEIAAVLDRSNARILADRHELVLRQQALERYLAEVAHDLRTPLASLLLAIQEVSVELGSGEQNAAIRRALGDAAYVTSLVDNLHEATRLRRGAQVTRGQADLSTIVERLGARFVALGKHQGLSVAVAHPETPVIVQCAPSFAERAVANLVHNAISYGSEDGNVAVLLEATGERFTLIVMDDGPGVPEEKLVDLREATFRTDAARQRTTGLGLAIANEVVRRAGWSIRYARLEPSGLQITIEGAVVASQAEMQPLT